MLKENIVIRTAKLQDALETLKIQKEVVAEGIFLTTSSSEFDKTEETTKKLDRKYLGE